MSESEELTSELSGQPPPTTSAEERRPLWKLLRSDAGSSDSRRDEGAVAGPLMRNVICDRDLRRGKVGSLKDNDCFGLGALDGERARRSSAACQRP